MDFENVLNLLGNFAFPVCFCIMLWKTNRDTQSAHEQEVKGLMVSIDKLTLAVQRLFDKLGGGDIDDKS